MEYRRAKIIGPAGNDAYYVEWLPVENEGEIYIGGPSFNIVSKNELPIESRNPNSIIKVWLKDKQSIQKIENAT